MGVAEQNHIRPPGLGRAADAAQGGLHPIHISVGVKHQLALKNRQPFGGIFTVVIAVALGHIGGQPAVQLAQYLVQIPAAVAQKNQGVHLRFLFQAAAQRLGIAMRVRKDK